jgi:GTP:adenosylcobinamide-phosphate guanylyltransferase
MLRAVITAGGRVDGAFAAAIGTPVKALAPFGDGLLIDRAIAALAASGIGEIAVVGDDAVRAYLRGRGLRTIAAADDGAVNVARALAAWTDGPIVYATSDLPFIDAAALQPFLAASAGYDLTMPLTPAAAYAAAYPGADPHAIRLGGERVANGSVFYFSASGRAALHGVAGPFFAQRKSAFGMARLLGLPLLLRFATGRLRVADVERRAEAVLGVRAAAVRDAAPGLCFDVDSWADYRYACAHR